MSHHVTEIMTRLGSAITEDSLLFAQHTAFRVYRGLLSAQSQVFSDMFATATPSAAEVFDECPAVRLSDSPQDLAHLLRVLLPKESRS